MRHLLRTLAHKAVSSSSSSWTRSKAQSSSQSYLRLFSNQLHSQASSSFGIAFDIDGVLLRGNTPIGGSPQALRRLYDDSGTLRVPYVFLTNGGGVPEFKRATELTRLLGINILPLQVIQGHTPFKQLVKRFENEFIVAGGKGEPAEVMSEYGFKTGGLPGREIAHEPPLFFVKNIIFLFRLELASILLTKCRLIM